MSAKKDGVSRPFCGFWSGIIIDNFMGLMNQYHQVISYFLQSGERFRL